MSDERQAQAKRWLQSLRGLDDGAKEAAWAKLQEKDPSLASYLKGVAETVRSADEARARRREGLREQISRGAGAGLTQLTAIVGAQGGSERARLFSALDAARPALAEALRRALFSFEKLEHANPKGLQKLLAQADRRRLCLALRGADEGLKAAFFAQLSRRAGEELREEVELLGPQRRSEVEAAQREIAELGEKLQQAGELMIIDPSAGDDWV